MNTTILKYTAAVLAALMLLAAGVSCTKPEETQPSGKQNVEESSTPAESPTEGGETDGTPYVAAQGILFPTAELTLFVGQSFETSARLIPENATNRNIEYRIDGAGVIAYENGKIEALAAGTAKLIAISEEDGYVARLTVTVQGGQTSDPTTSHVSVQGVLFPAAELTLVVGQSIEMAAQIVPENAENKNIEYQVENGAVISYQNGRITALGEGTSKLIAVSEEEGYVARLTVTVVPDSIPTTPTVEPTTPTPTTETPTETTTPAGPYDQPNWLLRGTADAGIAYRDRLTFLGDSTTAGMITYKVLTDGENTKQVWRGAVGNTITFMYLTDVNILYPETNETMPILSAVKKAKPEYLVITLGVTGGVSQHLPEEDFVELYEWLLEGIFRESPNTKVIVQSIFPVEKNRVTPAGDYSRITNEEIIRDNGWIKEIVQKYFAQGKNVRYSDVYGLLLDAEGYLDPKFGNGDGLHIGPEGYAVILDYLCTHAWID